MTLLVLRCRVAILIANQFSVAGVHGGTLSCHEVRLLIAIPIAELEAACDDV